MVPEFQLDQVLFNFQEQWIIITVKKLTFSFFPVRTYLLRLLELGHTFLFSGRGKEHNKEENKNWRRSGKWKISKTKMNVSILTSVNLHILCRCKMLLLCFNSVALHYCKPLPKETSIAMNMNCIFLYVG
jgi:hypothetical protein